MPHMQSNYIYSSRYLHGTVCRGGRSRLGEAGTLLGEREHLAAGHCPAVILVAS